MIAMKTTIVSNLKKMKELLDSEDKWTKIYAARNKWDHLSSWDSKDAVSFCLVGAACRVSEYSTSDATIDSLRMTIGDGSSVALFNDNPETTYQDVIQLIDKTIERLEKE